jgi:hypothetical protein
MVGLELDREPLRAEVALNLSDRAGHGAPVAVAYGGVDAAQDLPLAQADAANEAGCGLVTQEQGTGAEREGEGGGSAWP